MSYSVSGQGSSREIVRGLNLVQARSLIELGIRSVWFRLLANPLGHTTSSWDNPRARVLHTSSFTTITHIPRRSGAGLTLLDKTQIA